MLEILLVISSCIVSVSTAVSAYLAWSLVSETRKLRKFETEPKVSLYVEMNGDTFSGVDLIITNVGRGAARNIQFDVSPGDPSYFGKDSWENELKLEEDPVVKKGLRYLAPNQTVRFLIGVLPDEFYRKVRREPWTVNVIYQDQLSSTLRESFVIDFSMFDKRYRATPPIHDVVRHLNSLRKDLGRIANGISEISVVTQSKKDKEKELE